LFLFFSNAEGGLGLICACLPVLNVLIAHYKKEYSSQKYYAHGSDMHLGDRSQGSKAAARWETAPNFGDESHLVTYAGTPATDESLHNVDGIRKTVAVEQTVESASNDSGSR
jgi:hypothetical protein